MLGPKSDNSITDGDGNTQVGHNSGTVTVGLTFEQHQAALEKALADKTADLERAHGAEKDLLAREATELRSRLADVEADYDARLVELAKLKEHLARYDNQIDKQKLDAAYAAIDRDDTAFAQALIHELLKKVQARREDAKKEEAQLHFELGKIAEAEIRWSDAADHYARAAHLAPDFDTLRKAREFTWRAGDLAAAFRWGEDLLSHARANEDQTRLATALNNHALTLNAQGQNAEAEALCRQALEIDEKTIGKDHPVYATCLNNLALVVRAQGRYPEAETLYRHARDISEKTIGTDHTGYAIRLNNLADVVQAQGRFSEAETLFRQARDIVEKTIGKDHPDYGIHLNNLAAVVQEQGREEQAERLLRQALDILEARLPPDHPNIAEVRRRLVALLTGKPET